MTFEPGRINVLIGANGAGKSNLLSCLRMVSLMNTQSLRRFVGEAGGASALLHYGPKHTPELEVEIDFAAARGSNRYAARLGYAAGDQLTFMEEQVAWRAMEQNSEQTRSLGSGHLESNLPVAAQDPARFAEAAVSRWIRHLGFFHFHDTSPTSPLRQNSRAIDNRYLRSNGSNLAAYLLALSRADNDESRAAWQRIQMLVQRVAPFVKELTPTALDSVTPDRSTVRLDWLDERDESFGVHHLSDGTLRAIALVTALAQPTSRIPRFLTIDEPELGLHPAAISMLVSLVRAVATHSQVVLATQSAALLDHFEPEEVIVVERADGASSLRRLDSAALQEWLAEYRLSELYDKNILGGRP